MPRSDRSVRIGRSGVARTRPGPPGGLSRGCGGGAAVVKIAVIGGGSTYTPELIEGFARRVSVLGFDELVLHDISTARLDVVGGLARRILARDGLADHLRATTSLEDAIDGASAVLIQLRVGGQQARL